VAPKCLNDEANQVLSEARKWINQRFGLEPIKENALYRRVPRTPWYYGDGATLALLFGVQVATGAMMMLSYSPHPDTAYASVEYITRQQTLGWFVRAIHYWSAGLMTVMIVWHVLRQILVAGYKSPREGTWLIGVILFVLVWVMGYTGYVLRWDERAIYALTVSLHMFYRVPLIGEYLVLIVQGGREITGVTLTRIYAVHVILVPLALLALVGYHLYLVMYNGVTSPAERKQPVKSAEEQKALYHRQAHDPKEGETFHPSTTFQSGLMALIVFGVVVILALTLGPAPLLPEANRLDVALPAEEWWWWWFSGLIALLPAWMAPWFVVVFPVGLIGAMLLLPFIDRRPQRGIRKRPLAVLFVVFTIIALLWLSDYRRRSPFMGWPDQMLPMVPPEIALAPQAELGRQLFATYSCNACHSIAGHGRQVGPDLARMGDRYSQAELRQYILHPPEGIPMPSYAGRISDEDLDRIVDFVLVTQTFPRQQ
jgi:ubiquinol-cytochrome c reductase cytochrome b subunit